MNKEMRSHLTGRSEFAQSEVVRGAAKLEEMAKRITVAVHEGMQPMTTDTDYLAATATTVERNVVAWLEAERALAVMEITEAKGSR